MPTHQLNPCEGADCVAKEYTARSFCVSCDCTYCDFCWEKQGPHRLGKLGQNGQPHERTSKDLPLRLTSIFESPERKSELRRLHLEDEDTLWFGVDKDPNGKCFFENTGRYTALMTMTKQPTATKRYPLLVSFVGQTGAGKSTLIKMLVSLKESNMTQNMDDLFRTPISGSVKDDRSPTSGDVHLYLDPQSAFSDLPMLYADCEGLEGGEVPPQSKSLISRARALKPDNWSSRQMNIPQEKNVKTGSREWAVRNVYPRLLYTFSDVIVFVLKNTRTFESVALRLLLEWASRSMESSVNQPVLPQVIIVLNASDSKMDDDEWDMKTATERLMAHVEMAIWSDPIKHYLDKWIKKGRQINSCEELIRCYYSNVRVVRIPSKGRNTLIKDQIDKLHLELQQACQASFKAKLEARQYCTTDELNRYLEAAFDHFATKPNEPFDFIAVALKADPIPQGFSDHISMLAYAASTKGVFKYALKGTETFRKLSRVVASCIMLDCIRYKCQGRPQDLFDQHYAPSCSAAIEAFNDKHLQCSFVSRKSRACVNSKRNHDKGHQDNVGRIMAVGPFMDPPDQGDFETEWLNMTRKHLIDNDAYVQNARSETSKLSRTREATAYELHRSHLMKFFGEHCKFEPGRRSCYGCLMEVPQHPLPCGHMLCTACVQMLGRTTDQNTVTVDYCPFENKWQRPVISCHIRFKPEFAGIRILSLDGGGVRGIVELESLRAIEKVLGKGLPIQAFFDLIVGTSTGGVIALGLGVKQWTVEQCITRFIQLCDKAFSPNEFATVKYVGRVSRTIFRSKYKTKALHAVLRQTLGEDKLYGQVPEDTVIRDTKVCVTTTSITAESGIAVGNYTRQSEDEHWYKFMCGDRLQVWEAACATTAAPKYFKRFRRQDIQTGAYEEYLDGALYFNNPVRIAFNERRFLWPDVADHPPDIVLSLGTGKNGGEIDPAVKKEMPYKMTDRSGTWCSPDAKIVSLRKRASDSGRLRKKSIVKELFIALTNMLDSILDAEREYKLFEADHTQPGASERYIRLNPDLKKTPPELDDTAAMLPLQEQVQRLFKTPEYELVAERIAYRLVASSFYFSKDPTMQYDDATRLYTCRGRIACRFEGEAPDMRSALRNLGEFFKRQSTTSFRPYFTAKESASDIDSHKIEIDRLTTDDMFNEANFHAAEEVELVIPNRQSTTTIFLCLMPSRASEPELFPISGFPRSLLTEDASTASRLKKRAELIKTKIKKSEMLVGNSLFDYYLQEIEAEEGRARNERIIMKRDQDAEHDALTLVGSPELDKTSTTASHGSTDDKASTRSNESKLKHTRFRTSRPAPHKSTSDGNKPGFTHGVKMSSRASMPDFRRSESVHEEPDDDDAKLVNALRPPASSEGAEIIDASAFLRDKSDSNAEDEHEGGSGSSTREIREERKAAPIDEDDSDSDGPPSDYED